MKNLLKAAIAASFVVSSVPILAKDKAGDADNKALFSSTTFEAMALRNIGPAYMSGRIADIEVDQNNPSTWFVAVGSGGIWKTVNAGTTWTPVFDKQAVYSTGDVTIDPNNSNIIWVGTGENNGGRHISFGDGIYKSVDGGKTWQNMGLKESERISDIIVHPSNSNIVWAAVQGPLWTSGGERGLYKTTDGGETWKQVLKPADEWTGVTSLLVDPRNPDRLYAATWSRQRTVAAYVGTGPGSGIHTSEDGGQTWTELKTGLPTGNMGKIGMAISPINPDIIYATIETDNRKGGFYRSENRGASWSRLSDEVGGGTGPHYYQEIFADQHQLDRVYIASNYSKVSNDGGKTWTPINTKRKHVDDHAFAFHPTDKDFVLIGSDGGIYMSHDRMKNWRFMANLPLTQFYKVAPDDGKPFYRVYAGAQDNSTQGGPSRTIRSEGIKNKDWFLTLGGDGHQPAVEPGNPNIMYSQWQQGNLMRHDLKTRENVYIKPQPRPGEPAERYNWDAPINVSSHDPKRIYHASQRVWRSDDRGDSWTPISGDLTKNGNRMHMPMMGRTWSVEAGWDLYAMSEYHTIANFSESPVDENILWVGTDDGLIQVTTDGGKNWRKIDLKKVKGVPETAYVNDIRADLFDPNTVYVALDNHKYGDFKPYLIKSTNLGKKWTSLSQDLPDKHLVWRIVQDHVNKDLLFIGTEFGIFFTVDGGKKWLELDGGMPTISTRDVKIQRRENDLVAGTFGRGIYILDDYAPLRELNEEAMEKDALLIAPSRPVKWFRLDDNHSETDGDDRFAAPNPAHGATLTYFLKESLLTAKEQRQEQEKKLVEDKEYPKYPSWDAIEAENQEPAPAVYIEITDASGAFVNRVAGKTKKGLHRITWNMTYADTSAITGEERSPWHPLGDGLMAAPGKYTATLYQRVGAQVTQLATPVEFELQPIFNGSLPGASFADVLEFGQQIVAAQRRSTAASSILSTMKENMKAVRTALDRTPGNITALEKRYADIQNELHAINVELYGLASRNRMGTKPANIDSRLNYAMSGASSSYGPTQQHREQFSYALEGLDGVSKRISTLQQVTIPALQKAMNEAGSPWTAGSPLMMP
ncbi:MULTISPECIES: VPS10 domain-containing protein [Pseudoalteromonas]|uniref:Glycosyl hydrolase n=1 Tax=Pseudoalteromonas amylolytica TaxID=1859457 RepID=A0A1S1MZ35_9GAMM|nr:MULTISPECIES: glycosyl hydrolase [Pseudoalteromonas]OHU90739.1 glycosyl hydrolase [Pseudoalteromonas sp. JW3]OHU92641.1 glycosyl hydrolase [Pseudoalteromonas amylolytica]